MKTLIGGLAWVAGIAIIVSVGVAAGFYVDYTNYRPIVTFACKTHGALHPVLIRDNKLNQTEVDGRVCDTLTITNEDDRLRLIAFGVHAHHQAYDGVVEKLLSKGQSLTIVLDQLGRYTFHDHLEDSVQGYFVVNK